MIGWRSAVILLLASNFAFQALQSLGYVSVDTGNAAFLFVPSVAARKALLCLLLMIHNTFIALACLVPALAALTFSLWLTRWYALPI